MREHWEVTYEEGKTRCESDVQVTYLQGHVEKDEAIARAREWQPGKNVPERKKTNKGQHMRKYWEYRKNGGTKSMKEYFNGDDAHAQ